MDATHRLRATADFERVRNHGKSWGHSLLSLQAVPTGGATRCGFVVSRRVGKAAVTRNLVRRRLREIMRPHLSSIGPGFDLVLVARPAAAAASFAQLREAVADLLARARLS